MSAGTIMPAPWFTGLDDDGNPISGGFLYVYMAGTSDEATVYHDADLGTPWTQPIELDGAGRAVVFLEPGNSYTFRLEDASHVLVKETPFVDAVPAAANALVAPGTLGETIAAGDCCYLSDGSGSKTAGKWFKAQANNAYASTTPTIGFPLTGGVLNDVVSFALGGDLELPGPLTVGATYYVDPSTAGDITPVQPTGPGALARRVGQAPTALRLLVSANPPTAPGTTATNGNFILASQVFS